MKATSRAEATAAGAVRYFTGKPCKNGHIGPRQTGSGACILCRGYKSLRTDKRQEAKDAGALRYFTGKPCVRGHIAERFTNNGLCADCMKENNAENREQTNAASRRWYQANKEHAQAIHKAHQQATPHLNRARVAQRRAAKMRATPAWADRKKIAAIYAQAVALGLTVDHVIPLTHKLVCGLHVENNLQLLTKKANSEKSNKFDPAMFEIAA